MAILITDLDCCPTPPYKISYIRGFASKLEAEKIKGRTMRGKRTRAMRGELPQGTGVGMYGYEWNKESKKRDIIKPAGI